MPSIWLISIFSLWSVPYIKAEEVRWSLSQTRPAVHIGSCHMKMIPRQKKKEKKLECEGTWFWNGSYSTLNQTLILILTGRKWNSATIWTYSCFLVWVYLQVSNFEKSAEIIGTASYLDDLAGYNGIKITDKLSKLPLVNAVLTMCSASEDEGDVQ